MPENDFLNERASDITRKITPYLRKEDAILDIGSGGAHVAKELKDLGYTITALDVKDMSFFPDIHPMIYDGASIPFEDDAFDVSLLLTVLHHIKDPLATLREAKRVSKRIVIMEDLHKGPIQKYLTFAMDSFLNREFFGHPHSNKTKAQWEAAFKDMGLKIIDQKSNDWGFSHLPKCFTSGIFYLEKEDSLVVH